MQKRMGRSRRGISIELQIDGEAWHRVASLEKSGPDDRHFVLTTDEATALPEGVMLAFLAARASAGVDGWVGPDE